LKKSYKNGKLRTFDSGFNGILNGGLKYIPLSPDFHYTTEFLLDLARRTLECRGCGICDHLGKGERA
jgi:hypothetical protein